MSESARVVLDLHKLGEGVPALTPALGQVHAECAAVCLEHQGHLESVELHVRKSPEANYELSMPRVTDEMRRAHHDLQRATEFGACGVALLLAREVTGLTAIQQSRKGTGFDYWLGPADQPRDLLVFQNSARLEVSGILEGTDKQIIARLKQKLRQSEPSDATRLPAYAVVVEFGRPQAELAKR
ncbi:MAG: hypothetical protein HY000_31085 [Planctomycetes bacterium]|nr:hypothetical protein [Planctomycetota bacterium]